MSTLEEIREKKKEIEDLIVDLDQMVKSYYGAKSELNIDVNYVDNFTVCDGYTGSVISHIDISVQTDI